MDISIFLARLMGLYLVIVTVAALLNLKHFPRMLKEFLENAMLVFFTGLIHLLFGLAVVLAHNIWVNDWRVIITLLGWFGLFKGLVRLYAPTRVGKMFDKLNPEKLIPWGIFLIVLGAYLAWIGFTA